MKQPKEMHEEQQPTKGANPLKIMAIVLSSLAAVLVLAAVGLGLFVWYSADMRGDMFSEQSDPVIRPTVSVVQEAEADVDWIDEAGNAYNYRDDVISILLMGTDYMGKEENWTEGMESNGGNADVLALVILNTTTFDFDILYIPRDTMVEVVMADAAGQYLGTKYTNISASHSYGDGGALSCRLTSDAVSRLLMDAPVNRYAALNYDAIIALNHIMGGIRITFDSDCTDICDYFTEGTTVVLSDLYLSMLVTYRDYEQVDGATVRGQRIMNVMKAMFDQLKDDLKENPMIALDIFNELTDYITTDLKLSEITYLAKNIGKMDFSLDTVIKLPGETGMGEKYAEFHADQDWIHDFVVEKFCVPVVN